MGFSYCAVQAGPVPEPVFGVDKRRTSARPRRPKPCFVTETTAMKTTILTVCLGVLPLLANPAVPADAPQQGLLGEYYSFDDAVEDFPVISADKKPALKRVDKTIDVDVGGDAWPGTELTDHFYIRWTGKIRIPKDGKYTFFLTSDDGSRLFIDGKQVIDNNGLHPMDEKSGELELKTGDHDLKIEFFENEGETGCKFAWQAAGDKDKGIVPASALSH
jgi:hypothetical protein